MNEDTRKQRSDTDGRDERGSFGPGNPGRPRGARDRVSAAAEAIIDDAIGDVVEKCVEMAKEGNTACISAILPRPLPDEACKGRLEVTFDSRIRDLELQSERTCSFVQDSQLRFGVRIVRVHERADYHQRCCIG